MWTIVNTIVTWHFNLHSSSTQRCEIKYAPGRGWGGAGERKIRKLSGTIDELHHRPFSVPCLPTDAPVSRYRYRLNVDTSTFAPVFMQPASDWISLRRVILACGSLLNACVCDSKDSRTFSFRPRFSTYAELITEKKVSN